MICPSYEQVWQLVLGEMPVFLPDSVANATLFVRKKDKSKSESPLVCEGVEAILVGSASLSVRILLL
ncbi:MAG: hypothetical protein DRH15_10260 [Deltaproteobacteria bacterium]|nr:MAG: hypothetical protein DRH15_10260 [Deltaproteobacteria bacterium]